MRKYLFLSISAIICQIVSAETTAIKSLDGEKWWGLSSQMGRSMPFENTPKKDFRKDNGNQAAPLLLSSKGRYVWCEKPFEAKFENGNAVINHDAPLAIEKSGDTLKEAYLAASKKYFAPTGEIPEPLFFSMPQYNTWIELMYNQNQSDILKYAHDAKANGFPSGVFMVDDNWQRYYGNYDFKPERFPNPKAMSDELHAMGFKIMLWIAPFVSPDSAEFRDLRDRGFLAKDKFGNPLIVSWWNGYSAMYDLTNPQAFAYVEGILRECMQKYGIDGFKFDAGDTNFGVGAKFFDATCDAADYSRKWVELAEKFKFNELRASWKMGGHAIVQRLSDKNYSWKELSWLIPDMLASGITGHAYACPDMIGGGEFRSFLNIDQSKLDQKLIVRSCQVHALMPMMQFSVAPWRVLDKKHTQICADFAKLHEKFGGLILKLAYNASKTGEPIVRLMAYEFPTQNFEDCKDQFMLGDSVLVAPVITPDDFRQVRLPSGSKWRDDLGKIHDGGQTIKIDVPIERLPYFEKVK